MNPDKKRNLLRATVYIATTFALSWGYCFGILYPAVNGESLSGIPALMTQLMTAVVMFFPAIGVLLTRLVTKEGFRGCWLKLNFRGNIKYYALAWFGPALLTLLGGVLYFLIFPDKFDPNCGYMVQYLESMGGASEIPIPVNLLLILSTVQALFTAPLLNAITCFGEEWGWRGYLLPKLSKTMPMLPALLVSGVIWGLWHAPLTAIGHNYGLGYPGFPFAGIAMMCLFCIVFGIILSYVTIKTGSCIPAVIGHGAINGIAAIGIYFTYDGGNPFVGPAPTGIIAMIPAIILALLMAVNLAKQKEEADA